MSVIRPLKPRQERHVCPDCSAPEGLFIDFDRTLSCKLCGWKDATLVGSDTENAVENIEQDAVSDAEDLRDIRQFKMTYYISNRSLISTWGSAAYDSALMHIKQKNWDEAIKALQRAVDTDRELVEAHLWLGRLLTDEKQQRDHLSTVIGYQPQNGEAHLELMYLNGQISLPQLEHALLGDGEVTIEEAVAPVKSETVILSCPVCGGHMTTHPVTAHVECGFCGHIEESQQSSSTVGGSLTTALLQQRSEGVKWVIGGHMLHCKNCGAERTIPKGKMGSLCMFCGSKHVIEQDALNSFRQPDGIIPFSIPQEQAEQAIQDKLLGKWERFRGVFVNQTIKQTIFAGTYLPFWLFDIVLDVKVSYRRTSDQSMFASSPATRTETHADVFNNYPFPAVFSPSPRLIEKIARYDFTKVRGYESSALARYSAEIYQVDFDTASLEARARVNRKARARFQNATSYRGDEEQTSVWTNVRNINFRLVLLPVWIATLVEDDDDIRIGLVNGQTGQAVLGKAHQPEHYG